MADGFAIETDGLREFRRDLKRLSPELDKELRGELKEAAGRVAREASTLAPRRTGRLAGSYRTSVTLRSASIRSRLPYAQVIEYGGTIEPKGAPIKIERSLPVTRAVLRQADRVVHEFGDAVERAADKTGWH